MKITFVKKIKADGSACKKCAEISQRLEDTGQINQIDEVVIADENNPLSPGMVLADRLKVERAPFFVVEHENGKEDVYTVYFKFVKEVLNQKTEAVDENKEILEQNTDLDFL
ncbi:MAG: hypothetical protein KUG66_01745 [Gammaproteobacteria bacterium]|nr:hypothetical protein [Gammaproteobacteria bacterium]